MPIKVPMAYPNVDVSILGTRLDVHPLAAAMPATVEGPEIETEATTAGIRQDSTSQTDHHHSCPKPSLVREVCTCTSDIGKPLVNRGGGIHSEVCAHTSDICVGGEQQILP